MPRLPTARGPIPRGAGKTLGETISMTYVVLTFVSIAITVWLCAFSWRHRSAPGGLAFFFMMLAGAFWLSVIVLMVLSPSQEKAVFWYRVSFVSVAALPVILLVFVAHYGGWERWFPPKRVGWLLVIPAMTQIADWTDGRYGLFFKNITVFEKNSLMVIKAWTPGPWFYVHTLYSYVLILAALVWLMVIAVRQFRLYRGQSLALIAGALVVVLPNVAFSLGLISPEIVILPFCFLVMGLFFAWAVFRHKLFDLVPVARNKLVDTMSDGMLVLDAQGRVVDANPAALTAVGGPIDAVLGRPVREVFAPWPEVVEWFSGVGDAHSEVEVRLADRSVHYDVRITPLTDKKGRPAGRLILFRDISGRKRIEAERENLIAKLEKALSEVKTLSGFIPICSVCKKIRDDEGYWNQIEIYIQEHSDAEFSHGICPDCMKKLYPNMKATKRLTGEDT